MAFFSRKSKPAELQLSDTSAIKALLFDTFGTTVDWLSSMTAHAETIGAEVGINADWKGLVLDWRAHYQPAIKPVREGKRPWTGFDELHREQLDKIASKYGAAKLTSTDRDRLTHGWHELKAWPEVPTALHRLARNFIIGPLSNGTTRQMVDLARYAGLPWNVVFGADMFRTYKPAPALYKGAVAYLGLKPEDVLMVAAHNQDLQAAQKHGMRTCFVHRPTEDAKVEGSFDFVVDDFEQLARTLNAV
ncbi:MAG: haloacid dehalogenase type II [Janthinobacterium lividum]